MFSCIARPNCLTAVECCLLLLLRRTITPIAWLGDYTGIPQVLQVRSNQGNYKVENEPKKRIGPTDYRRARTGRT